MKRHSLRLVLALVRGARSALGRAAIRHGRTDGMAFQLGRVRSSLTLCERLLIDCIDTVQRQRRGRAA
jgi:hypothetical protein